MTRIYNELEKNELQPNSYNVTKYIRQLLSYIAQSEINNQKTSSIDSSPTRSSNNASNPKKRKHISSTQESTLSSNDIVKGYKLQKQKPQSITDNENQINQPRNNNHITQKSHSPNARLRQKYSDTKST